MWTRSELGRSIYDKLTKPLDTGCCTLNLYTQLTVWLTPLLSKDVVSPGMSKLNNKSWFDSECIQCKQELTQSFKDFQRFPNETMKEKVQARKREYKALVRSKKLVETHSRWQALIKAAKVKNSREFWKLIAGGNRQSKGTKNVISARIWEEHFTRLYSGNQSESPLKELSSSFPQWNKVSIHEVESLINNLKYGKAPGSDYITAELLKSNVDWWAPLLANLFTYIDQTGVIPEEWGLAIVIPIYKKNSRSDPNNYRPISLINTICKLYTKHLCVKLCDWLEQKQILEVEQGGFTRGRSTLDHCLVLDYLVQKYVSQAKGTLFAAFVDLKAAFDSVDRERLWEKLAITTIDKRLLFLMFKLYENTSVQIKYSSEGNLSKSIQTQRGVRQGCLLAPFLFNFYVNCLITNLKNIDVHAPKLDAEKKLPILMYADDAVLLSVSRVGLNRALLSFTNQCQKEGLSINFDKTKVIRFHKRLTKFSWRINGHDIEQVKSYKYLGVTFTYNGSSINHIQATACLAERSAFAILAYFRREGACFVPAALKLYRAKVLSQMCYGMQAIQFDNLRALELVQSKFLRALFDTPRGIHNVMLRQEAGLLTVDSVLWLHTLYYWVGIYLKPTGLIPALLASVPHPQWSLRVLNKLRSIGLDPEQILESGFIKAKRLIRERLTDIEAQNELAVLPPFYKRI